MIIGGHVSIDSQTLKEKVHIQKSLPKSREDRFKTT